MPELQQVIGSAHFAELLAEERINPRSQEREDWRSGMVACVMANLWKDPKSGRTYRPQDFMPRFGESKEMTPEDWQEWGRRFVAVANRGE